MSVITSPLISAAGLHAELTTGTHSLDFSPHAHVVALLCHIHTSLLLQKQREARERVKELSKRINSDNTLRLAASPPAKPRAKELSARQRAAEYAKASVPKPELLKQRSSIRKRGSSAPAAVAGGDEQQQPSSPLHQLQQQHDMFAQQIEQIRQELAAE